MSVCVCVCVCVCERECACMHVVKQMYPYTSASALGSYEMGCRK